MSDFSIQTLIAKSAEFLAKKEVAGNHRLEAELLLSEILGVDRIKLILKAAEQMSEDQVNSYRQWVVRRSKNEPVAYILGYKEFLGERFTVSSDVLIPRPETEELCAWVLERYPKATEVAKRKRNETESLDPKADFDFSTPAEYPSEDESARESEPQLDPQAELQGAQQVTQPATATDTIVSDSKLMVLDLATGSGCIGISLQKLRPSWQVHLSDVSRAALAVATKNWNQVIGAAPANNIFESDWFVGLDHLKGTLDLIVTNPPYIATSEKADVMPDVRDFEPSAALFVDDPTHVLLSILKSALDFLKAGGEIYMEAASPYLEEAQAQLQGYQEAELKKDEFGKVRFLRARK